MAGMHPIERLRMVARSGREDPSALAREAASALATFGSDDPAGLVTACRRLVERQPTCGPLWWLGARVLAAADPPEEAWRAAEELYRDPTAANLAAALPEEACVVVLGWPDLVAEALVRRGDVRALVVDALSEGAALAGWLRRSDGEADAVPESGLGAAVRGSDLVLLEASAMGAPEDAAGDQTGGMVAVAGSAAAAAVARLSGVPVWVVAGAGRVLPPPLWDALVKRFGRRAEGWDGEEEIVSLAWVDLVAGPDGLEPVTDATRRATCPPAPELAPARRR